MSKTEDLADARRIAFGRRLREVRLQRGLTQLATARASGLDRSFYVEVETAKHSISVDRLYQVADALGASIHDLLPQDSEIQTGTSADS
ncbi:helix-turn-helix domain-containing protein [Kitasatospora sp. NPDC058478]|uniref:helix-turn-helix domain-containing protein n=1 Tax=unclassified Kitasatospora TaxID=2633591 RepID=UPI00365152F1